MIVEPKVDGISVSLLYANGALRRAVTRGDGRKGDVITKQVAQLGTVPTILQGASDGEARDPGRDLLAAHRVCALQRDARKAADQSAEWLCRA